MKKVLFTLFAMLFVIATSCKKDDPKPAPGKDDPKTPPTEKVEVTSVTLNKTTLTLTVDNKETLTATIAPENATDKTITWSSSKTDIATVDKTGAVTAVAAGEATITATSSNGKKAECKVTIKAKDVPVESISLNKTELTLTEGSEYTLQLTILPEGATYTTIEWTSSEESIATINQDGKITAIAEGETTITVTTSDGNKTATCTVTVVAAEIHITAITITPESLTIKEGTNQQLTITFTPEVYTDDDELEWVSTNPSVATISPEGVVTALAEGTTTIAVRLKSNTSIQASCSVTVEKDASLKGISLNSETVDLQVDKTYQLQVNYNPTYAANKTIKSWVSSNPAVATVDNTGKVTAVAIGTATITATSEEGNFTATCTVNITAKSVDIYTMMLYNGYYRLFKNFELNTDNGIQTFQVVNNDIYCGLSNGWILKNNNILCDINLDIFDLCVVNGTIYAIAYHQTENPRPYYLFKVNPDGTFSEINIPLAGKKRQFEKVVANVSGTISILGKETDAFNEEKFKIWTISSSEEISEMTIPFTTHHSNVRDLTIDSNGDAWAIFGINDAPINECYLYKNSVYQATISTNNFTTSSSNNNIVIRFKEDDRYIAYTSGTGCVVMKNDAVLYTLSTDYVNVTIQDMDISSNGDVYLALECYNGSVFLGAVYKNSDALYTLANWDFVKQIQIVE